MKKMLLLLLMGFIACSESEKISDSIQPKEYNQLKAYKKSIAFYSYNTDLTKNGLYRIYLDSVNNIFSQYTSQRITGQSDILEEFNVQKSQFYKNYKNTNIDYMCYEISNSNFTIILSHDVNTDRFVFKRYDNPIGALPDDSKSIEYFKKIN